MSLLQTVLEAFAGDNTESPNTPMPLKIDPWGENRVLGIVIPNKERQLKSGIVLADTKVTMDRPHACQIVKVSEKVTDEYPNLNKLKETHGTGTLFDGPYVLYNIDGGKEWDYTDGRTQFTVVLMHARNIHGGYTPCNLRPETTADATE